MDTIPWLEQEKLAQRVGMVIPVYFSAKASDEMVERLLQITLGDCHHYLPLEQIWAVVDGDARSVRLLEQLRSRLQKRHGATFHLLPLPANCGKLWAMREGIRLLLAQLPEVEYVLIRDGDGDHAASDIPHLLRAAYHLQQLQGDTRFIIIGRRHSRHRPMGWWRGELEELLDGITLDALAFRLAQEGRALNLRYCLGPLPDLSSGYKIYGRQTAEMLFIQGAPRFLTLSPQDYWHYGPETVTVIEAILQGTTLAEVQRATWDGQPTTSFGEFRHLSLYGELLAWVYARLEVPLPVAAQFYDNRTPSLALRTTEEGRRTLAELRTYALEKLRAFLGSTQEIPPPSPVLPFV